MSGAIVGGKCVPSQGEALDAYYSAIAPSQVAGASSYLNEFVKISGVWNVRQSVLSDTGVWTVRSTSAVPVVSFPACDYSAPFFDGMALGWSFAAAMVAVAAFLMMKRGARGG